MIQKFSKLDFKVTYNAAPYNASKNPDDKMLFNFAPIALFGEINFTTSNGQHFDCNDYALAVCLKYKLITVSKDCIDLSIGCDENSKRREEVTTNNKDASNSG